MNIKIFFYILFCSCISYGQNFYTKDDLANIVVCIGDQQNNNITASGTATIINNKETFYVLTASHIVDSLKGNCILIFKNNTDEPVFIPLTNPTWIRHIEADLACTKIYTKDSILFSRLKDWSFPINQIYSDKKAISRDASITVIGFPVIDEIGKYFSPLTYNSNFSSGLMTMRRADNNNLCTFQFLENPSVQGYSGGPVLMGVKKFGASVGPQTTYIVGIMHGTFGDNTGGKLSYVTPSFYIFDLIK